MARVSREVHLANRVRAWHLRVTEHMIQTQIAEEMGVTQGTVSRWLAQTAQEQVGQMQDLIAYQVGEQLARHDVIYVEAMRAWEQSKQPSKLVKKRTFRVGGTMPSGAPITGGPQDEDTTQVVEDADGDTVYLQTALKALQGIRQMLGLDAPTRQELSGPGGTPLQSPVQIYLPDNGRGDVVNNPAVSQGGEPTTDG